MRAALVVLLALTSLTLAGCAGGNGDGDDIRYVCSNGSEINSADHPEVNATKPEDLARFCPGATTTGTRSNTTAAAPNVLPTLVIKITNMDGEETPVTVVDGNLTFDATGSTDPDGQIAGIAVTVTDSNTTRVASLYDAVRKAFTPATFMFDRQGPVNVTIAMVDDRAGFTVNETNVYVNNVQAGSNGNIQVPSNGGALSAAGEMQPCGGGSENDLYDSQYYKEVSIDAVPGLTAINVVAAAGQNAYMTICFTDGASETEVSDPKQRGEVSTLPGVALPPPMGTTSKYFVGIFSGQTPQMATDVTITVHYEPQEAAPAAA